MRYATLATTILCLTTTLAEADNGKYTVYGVGGQSCGGWIAASTDQEERNFHASWLLGWISAAGYYDVRGSLKDTDSDALIAWTDNYCRDHPLDTLFVAAAALVRKLAKPPETKKADVAK